MAATQPTTAALLSLLPSYNPTTLPPLLLNTATSLLAQSRQRASNLKPEEEIARAYVCAEIAVNRLREQLRLPPKKTGGSGGAAANRGGGGPPCKPSVYKKLLTFLDGVLVLEREGLTPRSWTKRKRNAVVASEAEDEKAGVDQAGEDEDKDALAAATPSKRARVSTVSDTPTKSRTPATRTTTTSSTRKQSSTFAGRIANTSSDPSNVPEAPPIILPTIRKLCKHFSTPAMAPHVYTGACIVLRLAELWPPSNTDREEPDFPATITGLTVALYLMVLTKMQIGQLKTKTFNKVCADALAIFGRRTGMAKGALLHDKPQIEEWIRRINREGWCVGQDWWDGVPEGVLDPSIISGDGGVAPDAEEDDEDEDEEMYLAANADADADPEDDNHDALNLAKRKLMEVDQLDKEDPGGILLPGLGTMMQESLDWNSEERRQAFETWKKGVVKRLQGLGAVLADSKSVGSAKKATARGGRSVAVH